MNPAYPSAPSRRPRRAFLWLLVAASIASCDRSATSDAPADLSEERATLIEASLRRVVEVPGSAGDEGPWSVEQRRAFYEVPGLAVVAWDRGRVVLDRAYGVRDAAGDTMTSDTPVPAGSILSGAVSSLVVAAQFSETSRNLNAPIRTLVGRQGLPRAVAELTLADVLSHRIAILPKQISATTGTLDGIVREVTISPGVGDGAYSESGYAVLQTVMEALALRPWPQLARERVFDPLSMPQARYGGANEKDAVLFDSAGRPEPAQRTPAIAASGLTVSASDLSRLLRGVQETLFGERRDPFSRRQLLLTFEPHHGDWGLGWPTAAPRLLALSTPRAGPNPRAAVVWQWDGRHLVWFHLEEPRGLVVMTNGARGARLAEEVLLAVGDALEWPEVKAVATRGLAPPADDLAALLGRYELGDLSFEIEWTDSMLRVTGLTPEPTTLVPRGPRSWTLADGPQALRLRDEEMAGLQVDDRLAMKVEDAPADDPELRLLVH